MVPAHGDDPIKIDKRRSAQVAILTAGRDRPYALGLASALIAHKIVFDYVGSDAVDSPELHGNFYCRVLKLRDQRENASRMAKITRVLVYYWRLIRYATNQHPRIFHILWNNKFELFDRTALMLYYKLMGKRLVLTAHNVNAAKRDLNDSWLNRFSLRIQYRLSDHILTHTEQMKNQLCSEFGVAAAKLSVIPFGINNSVPNTSLTSLEAKRRLGLNGHEKAILFFGNIAPYKGLEYLVAAFAHLAQGDQNYRLMIVGKPKRSDEYWKRIRREIEQSGIQHHTIQRIEYVPDDETEVYFKAADVLVLPYTRVFQSGVLFLAYSFGLPVIAAEVGSITKEIVEGKTGLTFRVADSKDLAKVLNEYFDSELFRNLERQRTKIKLYANQRYSWEKVAAITTGVYSDLPNRASREK